MGEKINILNNIVIKYKTKRINPKTNIEINLLISLCTGNIIIIKI